MKCNDIEKYSEDFLKDSLNFTERQEFEFHLEECFSCQKEIKEIQQSVVFLKKASSISPSPHFDTKMMNVFNARFQKQEKTHFWKTFASIFSISKPAFAMSILALIAFSATAFQLGKISAKKDEKLLANDVSIQANPTIQIVEKRVEIPVVKTIEVPVYREKIVNKLVYVDRKSERRMSNQRKSSVDSTNELEVRNVLASADKNSNFTPINLKGFQPVSEIKVDIIKVKNQ